MVIDSPKHCMICLLGSFSVEVDDQLLQWQRRKTEALVAYLAIHPEGKRRETLATLLWENSTDKNARVALRRSLSEIKQSHFAPFIDIQRDSIRLLFDGNHRLSVDTTLLEQAQTDDDPKRWHEAIKNYKGQFLEGFSVKDSIGFDDWQISTAHYYENIAQDILARLGTYYLAQGQHEEAITIWRKLYTLNPLHEDAVKALMQIYQHMGLEHAAANIYEDYAARLNTEIAINPPIAIQKIHKKMIDDTLSLPYYIPGAPQSFVGREKLLQTLVKDLQIKGQRLILQGWPGIGKTTITGALSHHQKIQSHFTDGILWTSLGEVPDLMHILSNWAKILGITMQQGSLEQMHNQLQFAIQDKKILLIIDDVWHSEHIQPLLVCNSESSTLLTTRFNDVARQVMIRAENIIKVPILNQDQSMSLLNQLAPQVIAQYPQKCKQLIHAVEGLPLALQVVGRLLYEESQLGWDVASLLDELCETHSLLSAPSPIDRTDIASQTTPTISSILYRSVRHLSHDLQEKFTLLGVFAPKPATFTLDSIMAVWADTDVRNDVRQLVNRGLLEPTQNQQFQMHALIAMLARSLVEGDSYA